LRLQFAGDRASRRSRTTATLNPNQLSRNNTDQIDIGSEILKLSQNPPASPKRDRKPRSWD
jgi:hypothetical protein